MPCGGHETSKKTSKVSGGFDCFLLMEGGIALVNSDNRFCCNSCENDFEDQKHGIVDIEAYKQLNPDTSDGPYPLTP